MPLKLYHSTTSVCAMKVRLALEEKALAWESELLSLQRGDQHDPAYLKLNPNGVVPTLVDEGRVVIESTLIIEYLDEAFPQAPLMPSEPYRRALAAPISSSSRPTSCGRASPASPIRRIASASAFPSSRAWRRRR